MPTDLAQLASDLERRLTHAAGTAIDVLPVNEYDAQAWLELQEAWYNFRVFVRLTADCDWVGECYTLDWLRASDRTSVIIRKLGTSVGALLFDRDNGKSAIRAGVKTLAYQFGKLGLDTPQDAVNKAHAQELSIRTGERSD